MLRIESEQEEDGRWIAEVPALPGVLAYGATKADANAKVQALALRVIADRLENGEPLPGELAGVFECVSEWPAVKASRVVAALLRRGWTIKRQTGSHRILQRTELPGLLFAFHDRDEIGPECWPALRSTPDLRVTISNTIIPHQTAPPARCPPP